MPRSIMLLTLPLLKPFKDVESDSERSIQGRLMPPIDGCCSSISPPQVGGRSLSESWRWGRLLDADTCLICILHRGYCISFQICPSLLAFLNLFLSYSLSLSKSVALLHEILNMVNKDALEIIKDLSPGLYSHLS